MSKKANPTVVGSFVIGAIVISIVGIMMLGGRSLLEEKVECILYFDESVSGLDVGAPVDFQGVRVGTVTGVKLEFDHKNNGDILRPVTLQLEESRINFAQDRDHETKPGEALEFLIMKRGLRARLATQSILTGKLKVELGYFPTTPVVLKNRSGVLRELPTIPSPFKQVASELAQLPLSEIVNEVHRAVKGMADILNPESTGKTLANIDQAVEKMVSVLVQLEAAIDPAAKQSSEVMASAKLSLDEFHATLTELNKNVGPLLEQATQVTGHFNVLMNPESQARGEFSLLLEDLQQTSKAMRQLVNYLEQHPDALLRGK